MSLDVVASQTVTTNIMVFILAEYAGEWTVDLVSYYIIMVTS